MAKDFLYP